MKNPNALFVAILMAIVGYAVWEAQHWDEHTRTFPTIIGSVLLVLLGGQLIASLRGPERTASVDGRTTEVDAVARRRQRLFIGWLLGFGAAIWLLSFPVGGTLAALAYLKTAGEKWPIAVAITAGVAGFFLVTMNVLHIFFPPGLLFTLLAP